MKIKDIKRISEMYDLGDVDIRDKFELKMIILGKHTYDLIEYEYTDLLIPVGYIVDGEFELMPLENYNLTHGFNDDEYDYEVDKLGDPMAYYIERVPSDVDQVVFVRKTDGLEKDLSELYVVDSIEGMDVLESFGMIDDTLNRGGDIDDSTYSKVGNI